MISRRDIAWLGTIAGFAGGLVGGIALGVGIALALRGEMLGIVLALAGVPLSGLAGWLIARRLAAESERV